MSCGFRHSRSRQTLIHIERVTFVAHLRLQAMQLGFQLEGALGISRIMDHVVQLVRIPFQIE